MDFITQPLPRANLTFDVVDDLVGAHARGRLTGPPKVRYAATDICPLIELMMDSSNGRTGPLLQTDWLDPTTQIDLRNALASPQNIWLDGARRRGFMRTTFDPRVEADDVQRHRFLIAARTAAETSGLVKPVAQYLAAALREMEWWRTQSQSNPSLLPNSLLTGKITGNFAFYRLQARLWRAFSE